MMALSMEQPHSGLQKRIGNELRAYEWSGESSDFPGVNTYQINQSTTNPTHLSQLYLDPLGVNPYGPAESREAGRVWNEWRAYEGSWDSSRSLLSHTCQNFEFSDIPVLNTCQANQSTTNFGHQPLSHMGPLNHWVSSKTDEITHETLLELSLMLAREEFCNPLDCVEGSLSPWQLGHDSHTFMSGDRVTQPQANQERLRVFLPFSQDPSERGSRFSNTISTPASAETLSPYIAATPNSSTSNPTSYPKSPNHLPLPRMQRQIK
jgi:hypothetical protein